MQTLDFLKLVLPSQGNYCWVAIKNKKAKQGFVSTIEELARKLLEEDAAGIDTYFACSSFLQPGSRKSENVQAVASFWLDLDVGEGKPFSTQDEALGALDAFCSKVNIPYALTVSSGYGLHAWWPLNRTIEPKEWRLYAARFKALCDAHGFSADPARTADTSSILRAPGTRNFKSPVSPKTVSVLAFEESGEQPLYENILTSLAPGGVDIVGNWDKLKPQQNEISLDKGFGDGQRTYALEQRCGLLFGPAHNCTLQQGIEVLLKWNTLNTPPLPQEKIAHTALSIFTRESAKRGKSDIRLSTIPLELPRLPLGYKWSPAGRLTTQVPTKNEDGEETLETVDITEFPLYLLCVTRKEREEAQAYMFMLKLPHEDWREFKVNCADFAGKNWKTFMSAHTAHAVLEDKLFTNYVHKADSDFRREKMDAIRYQQFGWKDNDAGFLVGDTIIREGGKVERVYGGEEIAHRMKQMAPRKGGSLNEWSKDANLLFSDQYIHLGYALVASFATTLLKFCMGESDGGFVLSITSPGSGKGKTRTIEACTSVWGELESLQITPRDTLNAQMAIVTYACNLPVFMDEWNEKDAGVQAKFLRQLTVGHDKNRAQRDGTVRSKPASYKTLLITTSNHSIYEIMNMINDEAAAARVVEIIAPELEGDTFKKFDKLTSRMLANSGTAGREFIFQLMQPGVLDKAKSDLTATVDRIREYLHTQGKDRYVTVLPAAILVTASLLVKHGILEFDVARLVKWSFEHVSNRVHSTVTVSSSEIFSAFLLENISKILMVSGPYSGGIPCQVLNNISNVVPGNLIGRVERDSKRLYLTPLPFRTWCLKMGHDYNGVVRDLEREGVLLDRKKKVTLGAGTVASLGRSLCWELNMSLEDMGGEIIQSPEPQ